MVIIVVLVVSLIVILCVYKKRKSTILKILIGISASGLIFSVGWIVLWKMIFKNENLDSQVLETVKTFDWTNKEKLISLGIEHESYEENDDSFMVYISDTQKDEYFYVYIYGGSNDVDKLKDPDWVVDGDFAYYCNIETYFNDFLIPNQDYYYRFETEDVEISVFGKCKALRQNNFERFVLEKLK